MPVEFGVGLDYEAYASKGYFGIKVVLYKSASEIAAAYFEGEHDELMMHDTDGLTLMTVETLTKRVVGRGVWGWTVPTSKENEVHIWVDNTADPEVLREEILATLAHERGHLNRPYHSDPIHEERKALRYELTAQVALSATESIIQIAFFPELNAMSNADLATYIKSYSAMIAENLDSGIKSTEYTASLAAMLGEVRRRAA